MFVHTNVLNPMKYVSLRNMECEVVAMTAKMFHGDETFVGSVTSGGSESILLAMKAYRDYFKASHPDIDYKPQVVLGETAHPAFMKAAQLFELDLVLVKVTKDWKMDVNHCRQSITKKTCCVVVSAP
jgi:sphinganine-1-phosphate aldolase